MARWLCSIILLIGPTAFPLLAQEPPPALPRLKAVDTRQIALKGQVRTTLDGLERWLAANPESLGQIVLFLDGHQLSNVKARWGDRESNELFFTLARDNDTRIQWAALLGRPAIKPRSVRLQVGVTGQQPFPGVQQVELDTLDVSLLVFAAVAFALLVGLFLAIASKSDLLREGSNPAAANARRAFSLGRTQMAVWFFIVVAAFVFIWIVTGSYDPLTPSVLGLIGISAGTALGAAVIDANKDAAAANRLSALGSERQRLETEIAALRTATAEAQRTRGAAPAGVDVTALGEQIVRSEAEIAAKLTRIQQIEEERRTSAAAVQPGHSQGLWRDLLSDENGISFHRFQIGVWTLVLAIVFLFTVYENLAMPDFDAKLLGLMGISSGTYLGFKLPEGS